MHNKCGMWSADPPSSKALWGARCGIEVRGAEFSLRGTDRTDVTDKPGATVWEEIRPDSPKRTGVAKMVQKWTGYPRFVRLCPPLPASSGFARLIFRERREGGVGVSEYRCVGEGRRGLRIAGCVGDGVPPYSALFRQIRLIPPFCARDGRCKHRIFNRLRPRFKELTMTGNSKIPLDKRASAIYSSRSFVMELNI
jgi:hypothetical protein